jgi:UDP-glucose 4-epimerase
MRVLVTGGAGYIGSVVCEQLLAQRNEVVVFDNLSTGHRQAVMEGCQFVQGDLRDTDKLLSVLQHGVDAVLHFAARSIVPESMQQPLAYWDHNLGSSLSLLRAMSESGVKRLVFSSTAAVYGEPAVESLHDGLLHEGLPCVPLHAYGASKRAIEMLLEDTQRAGQLQCICLRYFNAAGASETHGESHSPETHLIPNLLQAATQPAGQARVFGNDYPTEDGTCVRDYVHVVELADAHLRALKALSEGVSGAINLGSGSGFSVLDVVKSVRRVTRSALPVALEPRRPGDPPRLVADIRHAEKVLGWRPQQQAGALDDIVLSAWQWLQRHPGGYE